MSDLVVDFHELEHSQAALEAIGDEFEHISDRAHADGGRDLWSDADVADAMHSFATNWKDHRETLLGTLRDAHKHTEACLVHFRATEESLAKALRVHHAGVGVTGVQ